MPPPTDMRRTAPAVAVLLIGLAAVALWLLVVGEASATTDGDPEAGRDLFATHCAACHGADAQGARGVPALTGASDRLGVEGVARTIREGRGGMPAFGDRLEEPEIRDLVAHLEQMSSEAAGEGPARSGRHMMDGRWGDMMDGWTWGVGLAWLLGLVLVLVLVVVGVVLLTRSAGSSGPRHEPQEPRTSPAREILDQRYARGEISREEYLAIRRDLDGAE